MEKTSGIEISESIYEFYGFNTFLKIKPAFNIGQVLFAFVTKSKEDKAIKNQSFDCYINVADALSLATEILFGTLGKKAAKEKEIAITKNNAEKENKEILYPEKVWDSGYGGVNEEKARIRKLRTDGKAVSRQFNVGPSMIYTNKAPTDSFVITAIQGPGKTKENGLITPCGGAEATVRVPVMSEKELKNMAEMLKLSIYSYMAGKYAKYYDYGDKKSQSNEQVDNSTPIQNEAQNKAQGQSQSARNSNPSTVQNHTPMNASTSAPKEPELKAEINNDNKFVEAPLLQFMIAKTKTPLTPLKDNVNLWMQVATKDNILKNVVFLKTEIDKVEPEKWQTFIASTAVSNISVSFDYVLKGKKETLYFKGFHK